VTDDGIETRECALCGASWTGRTDPATEMLPLPIDVDHLYAGRMTCEACHLYLEGRDV